MASRKKRNNRTRRTRQEERRLTVRGVRRDPPDIQKISKALISLAMAEAERDAMAEQEHREAGPEATTTDDKRRKG
ncbi:hypothetical protein QFZ75_006331 [Streptomyces sp. V3I8]|uniref:hypothetical protein n=1 Tax=Streptomyces sp. V3I8 TaxID=3042279 RepID=UPI0027827677|nr:hypothetical protein [Streptomyces sp. V3I8]MDQ1039915.1 hypothetical protein [Streptomyces sp. V3I8]